MDHNLGTMCSLLVLFDTLRNSAGGGGVVDVRLDNTMLNVVARVPAPNLVCKPSTTCAPARKRLAAALPTFGIRGGPQAALVFTEAETES